MENGEPATDNTLPVTLEAIANLEKHPSPADLNGIDLTILYNVLANMTAGYPIDELENGPTKEFLKQCYTVSQQNMHFDCNLLIGNHTDNVKFSNLYYFRN